MAQLNEGVAAKLVEKLPPSSSEIPPRSSSLDIEPPLAPLSFPLNLRHTLVLSSVMASSSTVKSIIVGAFIDVVPAPNLTCESVP